MDSVLFAIMAFLIGGGGSDLLDYIPPADFWKDKGVAVTVDAMAAELKPVAAVDVSKQLEDLNSPDPQIREDASNKLTAIGLPALQPLREAVRQSPSPQIVASARKLVTTIEAADRVGRMRRLMAIRALGDLPGKSSAEVLQPLLKSEEPFVADYAREAIARLCGKPVPHTHPPDIRQDVWLLPDGCRAVGQVLAHTGNLVPDGDLLKRVPLRPGQDREALAEGVLHTLVRAAESVGNVRFDAISFGISGDVGQNSGYFVAIARGQYDSHLVTDLLHLHKMPSKSSRGVEIFQPPGAEAGLFFPSDHYAVFVASPRGLSLPTDTVVEAIKSHVGKLKAVDEMKRLIDATEADQPMWAVIKVTPAYAHASVLAPFESVRLQTTRSESGIAAVISAKGTQPENAQSACAATTRGAKEAADGFAQEARFVPALKILSDIFRTVKCDTVGGDATLTAKIDRPDDNFFLLGLLQDPRASTQPAVHR